MSEGIVPSSMEVGLASNALNFHHQQQVNHNTALGQHGDPNIRLQTYPNTHVRYSHIYFTITFNTKSKQGYNVLWK